MAKSNPHPFSHQDLTDGAKAAIRSVPAEEWKRFFFRMKHNQFARIGQLDEKQLTEMQAGVNMLDTIEAIFVSIKNTNT